jgi:predicted RNA-binding Zn ribbon-like protein
MYDFDAGDLSLNFANTKNWHASDHPVEELKDYGDLLIWGQEAALISNEQAENLKLYGLEHPEEINMAYDLAIEVREAIYRIFSNHYARKPALEADLALLSTVTCQAMSNLRLIPEGNSYEWQLPKCVDSTDLIIWPVARAAAELLTSKKASLVRECEDDRGCGYLFIDSTKNHSRRWCSMESCGNRAKARRHYSRKQVT